MATDEAQRLRDLIDEGANAMLTTHDDGGQLVARPMGLIEMDDDDCLWFFTDVDEPKTRQIERDPRVGVTFADKGWVSLQGRAQVVRDVERQRALWSPAVAAWMQCEPDDPKVALIRVQAEGGQYWASMDAVPALLSMIVNKVTGREPSDEGQGTHKVELG